MTAEESDRFSPGDKASTRFAFWGSSLHEPVWASDEIGEEDLMSAVFTADVLGLIGMTIRLEPLHYRIREFSGWPGLVIRSGDEKDRGLDLLYRNRCFL